MQKLYWETIKPKNILNSIWEDMDTNTIDYEAKTFENIFQIKKIKILNENINPFDTKNINDETRYFISKKLSQKVLIGLKKLNMNNIEIRKCLLTMNDKV